MMNKYIFLFSLLFSLVACGQNMPKNYPNTNTDIIAFGDSLTYGYGAGKNESYPAYLSQMLDREIVNLGINGDTSAMGLARIKEIENYSPYMVLVEFSANDFFRQIPREQTEKNLRQMVEYLQKLGAIVVLVDTGGAYPMDTYTKIQKRLAKEYNTLFVPGILDGIYNKKSLKSDQVHPNAEGYKIVAQKVNKVIKNYL